MSNAQGTKLPNPLLTTHELKILHTLSAAWTEFLALKDHPTNDIHDFRTAIHTAMRIVLARPGRRQIGERDDLVGYPTPPKP